VGLPLDKPHHSSNHEYRRQTSDGMSAMQQKGMLDEFRAITLELVTELRKEKLADYCECIDGLNGSQSKLLVSPEAMNRKEVLLIVSGIPEEAGVWSYTLLQHGRRNDSSMRPYFEMAREVNWGLVALNPHGRGIEGGRPEYHRQLGIVLRLLYRDMPTRTVVVLCFSAGGSVLFEFLNNHSDLAERISGVLLIDTTPPPFGKRMLTNEVQRLLSRTVLYGLEDDQNGFSARATATASVLGLRPKPIRAALHGELPNLLVDEVASYLRGVASAP